MLYLNKIKRTKPAKEETKYETSNFHSILNIVGVIKLQILKWRRVGNSVAERRNKSEYLKVTEKITLN
jgi:hypothetical protein